LVCADTEPTADSDSGSGGDDATHNVILRGGGNALFVATSVRCSQDMQNLVRTTVSRYGRLDMYVRSPQLLCLFLI
jgi:NAD(P)-dependent dehydrogenase (short-subunit alcohol dehydrogenase family)